MFIQSCCCHSHCSLPFIITFCFIYVIISLNPPPTLISPQSFINNATATRQHGHLNTVTIPLAFFLTSTQNDSFLNHTSFFSHRSFRRHCNQPRTTNSWLSNIHSLHPEYSVSSKFTTLHCNFWSCPNSTYQCLCTDRNLDYSVNHSRRTHWCYPSWFHSYQYPSFCLTCQSQTKNHWRWHCIRGSQFLYHHIIFFRNFQILRNVLYHNQTSKLQTDCFQHLQKSLPS